MKTLNRQWIKENFGYDVFTTFYDDFSIADAYGVGAIRDTYSRALEGWKHDYKYMTELCLTLNWKIWEHYANGSKFAETYDSLWRQCEDWCYKNLKGDELQYFIRTTD